MFTDVNLRTLRAAVIVVCFAPVTGLLFAETAVDFYNRALEKRNQGNLDAAIIELGRAIELDPTTRYLVTRGNMKRAKGDLDGAMADANRALEINPKHATALSHRGCLKEAKGDLTGAQADYERSLAVNPTSAEYVRFRLVLLLRRQHRDDSAAGLPAAVAAWADPWLKQIGRFLLAETKESEFLAEAEKGDAKTIRAHQCDAFYYVAMQRLIEQRSDEARGLFEKCIATGETFEEVTLAKAELARLP